VNPANLINRPYFGAGLSPTRLVMRATSVFLPKMSCQENAAMKAPVADADHSSLSSSVWRDSL
jgi:hypothetical protein